MRIIAGTHRGLVLAGPEGQVTRPTADRVREAVFNLLTNGRLGNVVAGAQVLDLFAGTGAMGLEALSRGATRATFVEASAGGCALIRRNVERMRVGERAAVLGRDATRPGENAGAAHDLVFLDPPYRRHMGEAALTAALAGGWLAPGALILWEEGAPPVMPPGFALLDQRRYGQAVVTLVRAPGGGSGVTGAGE